MSNNQDIISNTLENFKVQLNKHELTTSFLDAEILRCSEDNQNTIKAIEEKFIDIYESRIDQYLLIEKANQVAGNSINEKYSPFFESLEQELLIISDQMKSDEGNEENAFQVVLNNISELKEDAYLQFQKLLDESNNVIDNEMKNHTLFVESENEKYDSLQENYRVLKSSQSSKMLSSIEQSKNVLSDLKQQLSDNSKNQTEFLNESILQVLETLRSTKNRMSFLFKSTTDLYMKQRERIDKLSHQRQKPHSMINQTVIHQFVKQINDVNQKKSNFEKMIIKELKTSKEIVGKKIIESDEKSDYALTRKYIIQYELIQKKADYLLKRNQSMSDLLISKYQNEIKKIKIDSFKRVEEIKLAYFMPAMFFLNSINLYSNFSFYTNESFDELDNLLTDLLVYNQKLFDQKIKIILDDSNAVEDYKSNLVERIFSVCSQLTDLITKIDHLSKEIISLESNSQLEIANIRKKIEDIEIKGNYDKYLLDLENDHFFAEHQHDSNLKQIHNKVENEKTVIKLRKDIELLKLNHELFQVKMHNLQKISELEQSVHLNSYQENLELLYADFECNKKMNDIQYSIDKVQMEKNTLCRSYHYSSRFVDEQNAFEQKKSNIKEQISQFTLHAQDMIDTQKVNAERILHVLYSKDNPRYYARYLEHSRRRLLESYYAQVASKIDTKKQYVEMIHHQFYVLTQQLSIALHLHGQVVKRHLLLLESSPLDESQQTFLRQELLQSPVIKIYQEVSSSIFNVLEKIQNGHLFNGFTKIIQSTIEKTVLFSQSALDQISKKRFKKKNDMSVIKKFLIIQIETIDTFEKTIQSMLNDVEKSLIENQILDIEKIKYSSSIMIKKLNLQYDYMIVKAVKGDRNRKKQGKQVLLDIQYYEDLYKTKIKKMNLLLDESIKKELAIQRFLKAEISKMINENDKLLAKDLKTLESNYLHAQIALDLKCRQYEKIPDSINIILKNIYSEELKDIEQMKSTHDQDYKSALSSLEYEISVIAKKNDTYNTILDETKSNLVKEKKSSILSRFSNIEQSNLALKSEYQTKIKEIQKKIPSDYMELYHKISNAEDNFLNQYVGINHDITSDFEVFLSSQMNSQLLQNHEVLNHPYTQFIQLEDHLSLKTRDIFTDTIEKSKQLKNQIIVEERKSKQKQDRIINV
ncbi:MAG: hypothetical protein PHC62_02140 [Candidatus Izemoplasmatales bacterium]|nr:hypothetical protein [Candidatus Izemoplasmatales bacterium]